jgi:sulfatase modifying factor 1
VDAGLVEDAGAGDAGDAGAATQPSATASAPPERRCPADMVRVARRFCVDRFEAVLVDTERGQAISAFYPPSKKLATYVERTWESERRTFGDPEDQAVPLPLLPKWEKTTDFEPRAIAKKGVVPNGYTTGKLSALACKNAGKRLCTLDEWRTACRGEQDLPFPYGDKYVQGKCNVFREGHPAAELHNDASVGHADPRLNLVKVNGKPLLRRTGETAACASAWEDDAIYDMVGNLDEWIDDPEGTFVGGFFSRSKKDGCASIITGHPFEYFDYSTGTRCCSDLPDP